MLPLASSEGVVDATDDVAEAAGTGADPARQALTPAEVERKDVDRGGDGDEAQADLERPSGAPGVWLRVSLMTSRRWRSMSCICVKRPRAKELALVNDAKCLRTANGRSAGELGLRRDAKEALEEARRQVDHAKAGPKGASGQ
jgi:hypothetical protein